MSDKLNPCPFCGSQDGYNLQNGDTYRWWFVMCSDCSEQVATCHSDRRTHVGGILPDRWEPADEAWNAASQYAADLRARAESAEAERDRLIAEVARQVESRDAVAKAEYRLIGELCAMQRDRDRLRDALIACRPAVHLHSIQMTRKAIENGGWNADEFEEAKRISALLDTIDAAAKGQG